MSFYEDMAVTAQDMIAEFGRNVTLRRINPGAYNAASHSNSGGSTVDHPVKAVFSDYRDHAIGTRGPEGDEILSSDRLILIAGIQPLKGDLLIDGADVFKILGRYTVKPGDIALLWKAQARK